MNCYSTISSTVLATQTGFSLQADTCAFFFQLFLFSHAWFMWPFVKEKHPVPLFFPASRVAMSLVTVVWGRYGGLLRFGFPHFRRQQHHLFPHFFKSCSYLSLTFACSIMFYYTRNLRSWWQTEFTVAKFLLLLQQFSEIRHPGEISVE